MNKVLQGKEKPQKTNKMIADVLYFSYATLKANLIVFFGGFFAHKPSDMYMPCEKVCVQIFYNNWYQYK